MNFEKARFNMIEQQIRPWEVLDFDVLDLLMSVRREEFVPEAYKSLALSEAEVPLGHGASSQPRPLSVGSIVLTLLPADAAALAAQRGYLPAHVPLLKRVGAVAPQHVCIVAGQVRIDGVPTAAALPADRLGRPLPSWPHCRPLAEGELFLLSVTNPASFDSRYFGPVSASVLIGVAHPVWLETRS